jgi:hypothetical protein
MFNYHQNRLPPDLLGNQFFIPNNEIHDHYTRISSDIHVSLTSTKLAENTIRYQGALLWNSLNPDLKSSPSIAVFKHKLKSNLIKTYTTSDEHD